MARVIQGNRKGTYTLEIAILLASAAIASILMSNYVNDAIRANIKSTEMQLNGATEDNRPF